MKDIVQQQPFHEASLNSLLDASLHILANMVSVQPSPHSPEDVDVAIHFHSSSHEDIYVSVDATNWKSELMTCNGDTYEHVITVPRSTKSILYKFRIGDSNWFHDGTVPAEPDGFFGFNNRFNIPEVPMPSPRNDFDEDTELESVAAVESVADTLSEAGTEDFVNYPDEAEIIDADEVTEDPDYAAYSQSQPSGSSVSQFFGLGFRNRL